MGCNQLKKLVILQARMGSSRLPGKVLMEINGRPMIEWQIKRILRSSVKEVILATSSDGDDDELCDAVSALGIQVFRGSLNDVHSRFASIVESLHPSYFVRLTGDCPLFMPDVLDAMLVKFESRKIDYLSNVNPPSFPDGLDIEIVSSRAFRQFSKLDLSLAEKEHVTLGLRSRPEIFLSENFTNELDLSQKRWTVDYREDFIFVRDIFEFFKGRETEFTLSDILQAIESGKVKENVIPHTFRNQSLTQGVQSE